MNSRSGAELRLAARLALVALVIGTSVTTSATERVTLSLALAGAAGWSFVPLLQLMTGFLLIRGARAPRIGLLDRYFATGWPWTLWILAVHAGFVGFPATRRFGLFLILTAAVPIIWTVRLLWAFCRAELRLDARQSWRRVAGHQVATYVLVVAYVWIAVALWPRIQRLVA